jgi:23S rRNA pseudouridine1911/1915/1917 synthase
MLDLGHPLVGDALYGGKPVLGLERQALHAAKLAFQHPGTRAWMTFEAPLPPDLADALQQAGLNYNRDSLWTTQQPEPD